MAKHFSAAIFRNQQEGLGGPAPLANLAEWTLQWDAEIRRYLRRTAKDDEDM